MTVTDKFLSPFSNHAGVIDTPGVSQRKCAYAWLQLSENTRLGDTVTKILIEVKH